MVFPLRGQQTVDCRTRPIRAAPNRACWPRRSRTLYYLCKNVIQARRRGNASLCVWLLEVFAARWRVSHLSGSSARRRWVLRLSRAVTVRCKGSVRRLIRDHRISLHRWTTRPLARTVFHAPNEQRLGRLRKPADKARGVWNEREVHSRSMPLYTNLHCIARGCLLGGIGGHYAHPAGSSCLISTNGTITWIHAIRTAAHRLALRPTSLAWRSTSVQA